MQMQQAALTLVALLKIYIIAESQARGTAFEPPFPLARMCAMEMAVEGGCWESWESWGKL